MPFAKWKARSPFGALLTSPGGMSLALLALLLTLVVTGCESRSDATAQSASLPGETWFDLPLGAQVVRAQLALTPEERRRGLMHREQLGPNEGMLFVFEAPSAQSFWMYNTPLPLSIGYFTPDGTLREIYPMYPHNRTAVASRRQDIQYALEMNQGWFAENGIRTGQSLDLEALSAAVQARGFKPAQFGLPSPRP